jgi:alpha-ketoglutarate-dependent taurine dioxygenase
MSATQSPKPGVQHKGPTRRKNRMIDVAGLIKVTEIDSVSDIPVVIEPVIGGINLPTWADNNREIIESLLLKHRAVLFRHFEMKMTTELDGFIRTTSNGQLLEYRDRSSPRHEVGDRLYTSTDYPADQQILLHNEGTYWLTWPLKIYFCCLIAAEQGGETPIADCRKIFNRISPGVRQRFDEKGVLYVRNYNDGFGLSWQEVFQTTDKTIVEEHCQRNAIAFEWKAGGRLRTRQVRPAVARHPHTGEMVWFNHAAFFHISSLEANMRDLLLEEFAEEDLPHHTYYGDATPIEASVLDELRDAYAAEKAAFRWQPGDVMLLDNMTIAHGREPFVGQRQIIVGMAEPFSRTDL